MDSTDPGVRDLRFIAPLLRCVFVCGIWFPAPLVDTEISESRGPIIDVLKL